MAIPTAFDHDLAEVENAAALVVLSLRNLRHTGGRVSQYDLDQMRATLRQRIQAFCDVAINLANQGAG